MHQRSYVNAIIQVISIVDYFCKDNVPKKDLLKYGTFIVSVAEAQSAEVVEQAITLFALPPGGSSLKKQSPLSISLNAYTGLSYGRERLTNVFTVKQDANVGSVTAPVGLAFNMSMKKAGCFTLFTSVIDVGALMAYRFNDPNSNDLPELKQYRSTGRFSNLWCAILFTTFSGCRHTVRPQFAEYERSDSDHPRYQGNHFRECGYSYYLFLPLRLGAVKQWPVNKKTPRKVDLRGVFV